MTSSVIAINRISSESTERLTVGHLMGFLLGRRDSILAASRDQSTVWVGLIFVFAAALAREYDGEDLRREPWHLLIPLAASLPVSFILFAMVRKRTDDASRQPFWNEYRRFLGLFWLTAPLALLYAIPYERMLDPAPAVSANLWTLALVATWRVLLITRVISVITGWTIGPSFWLVMFVADAFALVAAWTMPLPVLQVMGGIRLTDAEQTLQHIGFNVRFLTVVTFPIWLIGALVALARRAPASRLSFSPMRGIAIGPISIATLCVLGWALVLPLTQREQRLRSDAERLLQDGNVAAALLEMSRHARAQYPPAWDPPPRLGWPEEEHPAVLDTMKVLATSDVTPWVRDVYLDKFERRWMSPFVYWPDGSFAAVQAVLDSLPEGPAIRARHAEFLQRMERYELEDRYPASKPATGGAQ